MFSTTCILHDLLVHVFCMVGFCMHLHDMCRAAVHSFSSAAVGSRLRVFIFFTATFPLCHLCMSGRGAAPPCISLFDLFPTASIALHFGLHGFDASACTSLRTSYRLLGWVTFVHHSVKNMSAGCLHQDTIRWNISFFIYSFEYIGFGHITWPILHILTFDFNGSSRAPAHGPQAKRTAFVVLLA